MSVETCAYINTDLTSLVEYLTNKYNLAAQDTSGIIAEDKNYSPIYDEALPRVRNKFTGELDYQLLSYNNSSIGELACHIYHGFISLPKVDDGRALFILSSSIYDDDDTKKFGSLWEDSKGCIYVSLSYFGSSVSIIKDLANEFGGLIDEDDCDDEPYYYVSPALDDTKGNH